MQIKKYCVTVILSLLTISLLADSGIYICGHFRRDRTRTVTALKASGFTFGIIFNVHVEADGTLTTDGEVICKDGQYVFDQIIAGYNSDKAQVNYVDDVNSLLSGNTSIQRLEYCIGGWGNHAYQNITNLVNAQGTGTSSILYRNFKALKDAIPAVIAVNNDIEHDYEANSQARFHIMLYDLGFKTTIAPYTNKSYWESFVRQVEIARPGAVDRNYLQYYGGGSGNNPANWKIENLPIYGSRDIEANPNLSHEEIKNTMTNWKNNAGIVGGFYWNYNYDRDLKRFSAPINEVFGGGEVIDRSRIVAMLYPVTDYKVPQVNFVPGSYTKAQIQSKGLDLTKFAAVKLEEGFQIVVYQQDNFEGDSLIITTNTPDISKLSGIFAVNSLRVLANNPEDLVGKDFMIQNKQSGFVIKPSRNGPAPTLYQMTADSTNFSLWTFESDENRLFKIVNKGSKKVLQVVNSQFADYMHDGAGFEQANDEGKSNQRFLALPQQDGSYKLIVLSSLKYVGIEESKQMREKVGLVQRQSAKAASTDWLLVAAVSSNVHTPMQKDIQIYPHLVENKIHIACPYDCLNIKIIDMQANVRIEQQISNNSSIDVSMLSPGLYFLQCYTPKGDEVIKFIKK
jgi:hypothetical protein